MKGTQDKQLPEIDNGEEKYFLKGKINDYLKMIYNARCSGCGIGGINISLGLTATHLPISI